MHAVRATRYTSKTAVRGLVCLPMSALSAATPPVAVPASTRSCFTRGGLGKHGSLV